MAYDRTKLFNQAVKAIKENKLHLMADVVNFLPCKKSTLYMNFPAGSKEFRHLNELLDQNKLNRLGPAADRVICRKRHKGSGYVYIIKCGDFNLYKIGVSKAKPKTRLASIQTGCPFPLYMVSITYCEFYSILEYEIHKKYRDYNKSGEWFELTNDQLACIQSEIESKATKQVSFF